MTINHDAIRRREEKKIALQEERIRMAKEREFNKNCEKYAKIGRSYEMEHEFTNLEKNYPAFAPTRWPLATSLVTVVLGLLFTWMWFIVAIPTMIYFFLITLPENHSNKEKYEVEKKNFLSKRKIELYNNMVLFWVKWAMQNEKKAIKQLIAQDYPPFFTSNTLEKIKVNLYPRLKELAKI